MFPSTLRSIRKLRAVGRPNPSTVPTQTRTLYFCGPKPWDRDPDLPISQHYHARSRTTGSDNKLIAKSPLATPPAQPATPTPTLRISIAYICSLPERHTIPSINKLETIRKAIGQLGAAIHDDTTTYNTAIVIVREIARLEVVLRRGEIEGKQWQELQRVRKDIEGLTNLWQRIERRM